MKKLILVINEDRFFLSHRTPVALKAAANGWVVTLVVKDTGRIKEIEAMGFKTLDLPVNPTGMNPVEEFKTLLFLYKLYKKNPDAIIHHVGLKNMLWGGIASRLTKTKGVVYAVSGLGTLFGENTSKMLSKVLLRILRFGLSKKNVAVIFQNHDDERQFIESGTVRKETIYFIKGSGVDLNKLAYSEPSDHNRLSIIFTGRMLAEKGVMDLVQAAELLRSEYEDKIEFLLCGGLSSNPSAISESYMQSIADGRYIKWLGHRTDIGELLQKSDIMCFPSYYREGVPKSLLEASAIGRPIVTTDSIGCRDTVEEGVNGFIVPKHNPEAIAEALKKLIEDKDLRLSMGRESRRIAERDYDVERVAEIHMDIYRHLEEGSGSGSR